MHADSMMIDTAETATADRDLIENLCMMYFLFAGNCRVKTARGFQPRAVACFRAMIDYSTVTHARDVRNR